MKKIIFSFFGITLLIAVLVYLFIYFATFSVGMRSGELIKFSKKGVVFKTWEGEISQGISGAHIFKFSVQDQEEEVIRKLNKHQGDYVKLTYKERYATFPWLGDTKYFITDVEQEVSPHVRDDVD